MPKSTKYKKCFKGRVRELPVRQFLVHGDIGIQASEAGRLKDKALRVIHELINKEMKTLKKQFWVRVFTNVQVSGKPSDQRMGRGKGAIDHWMARIPPCKILFEFKDVPIEQLKKLHHRLAPRFGFKTTLRFREPLVNESNHDQFFPHMLPHEAPPYQHVARTQLVEVPLDLTNRL